MRRLFNRDEVPLSEKPRVVIVGAGIAGASVARELIEKNNKFEVIVLERRQGSVWKPAGFRAAVEGASFAHKACVPLDKLIPAKSGQMVFNNVVSIRGDGLVVTDDNQTMSYDYLVCASGARNRSPCEPPREFETINSMKAYFVNLSEGIQQSSKIVILGGGTSAIELAGEIKSTYPSKSVSMIVPERELLGSMTPKPPPDFYEKLEYKLRRMGITLHMDQVATNLDLGKFAGTNYIRPTKQLRLSGGAKIHADLVLLCSGLEYNTSIYPASWKEHDGSLKVRKTMQLTVQDNVFAVGDVANISVSKQAFLAQRQAAVIAKNINCLEAGKFKLVSFYPPKKTDILLPLGKKDGLSYVNGNVWGKLHTGRAKGADLFVKKIWNFYREGKELKQLNTEIKQDGTRLSLSMALNVLQRSDTTFVSTKGLQPQLTTGPSPVSFAGEIGNSFFPPSSPTFSLNQSPMPMVTVPSPTESPTRKKKRKKRKKRRQGTFDLGKPPSFYQSE